MLISILRKQYENTHTNNKTPTNKPTPTSNQKKQQPPAPDHGFNSALSITTTPSKNTIRHVKEQDGFTANESYNVWLLSVVISTGGDIGI